MRGRDPPSKITSRTTFRPSQGRIAGTSTVVSISAPELMAACRWRKLTRSTSASAIRLRGSLAFAPRPSAASGNTCSGAAPTLGWACSKTTSGSIPTPSRRITGTGRRRMASMPSKPIPTSRSATTLATAGCRRQGTRSAATTARMSGMAGLRLRSATSGPRTRTSWRGWRTAPTICSSCRAKARARRNPSAPR